MRVPTLRFIGGAGTVTGSKSLIETGSGRLLVDCGLFQGPKRLRLLNWDEFPVPPDSVDAVVVTHAHLDHCGYLPRLVRGGFDGPVFCTEGTRKLADIVLRDSAYLLEEEAEYANRKGYSKHDPALPLYTQDDARACLELFETVEFATSTAVLPGVAASWERAGHILGAASIHVELDGRRIVFSGDLGRNNHPLLCPPAPIGRADIVVVESTYGDEDHDAAEPQTQMADAINTAAAHGGVVVIPSFAVDRTEVVLWHLDRLVGSGRVPDLPIFVDSPMACSALDVYASEVRAGSPEVRPELHGTSLFPSLRLTEARTREQSIELNSRRGPFIVVSASGMATGGRVIHHLANRIGDSRNVVMLVGFQAPGTRGDALRSGSRQLKLYGHYRHVAAKVVSVTLSAHAGRDELLDWIGTASPRPELVLVNHGEADASAAFAGALDERLGVDAVVPRMGEVIRLDRPSAAAVGTGASGS
jgi:metallo-beta-lactamase family protein